MSPSCISLKVLSILILVSLIFGSCATLRDGEIYQSVKEDRIESAWISDSLLSVDIAYIGAIGHSYVFECTIENYSDQSIIVDKSDFYMSFNQSAVLPANEDSLVEDLKNDKKRLKKSKKGNTLFGGILVGIGVVAGAASGLPASEVLAYSADPVIAIFEDRVWHDRNIGSIEDEIEYIRGAQFDQNVIRPGGILTRDLLFPSKRVRSDVDVFYSGPDSDYIITFPKKIFPR